MLAQRPADAVIPNSAQDNKSIKVIGKVVDADQNDALEFATISIFSKLDTSLLGGGLTGAEGQFTVEANTAFAFAII